MLLVGCMPRPRFVPQSAGASPSGCGKEVRVCLFVIADVVGCTSCQLYLMSQLSPRLEERL